MERYIKIATINIALTDHTRQRYVDLMTRARELGKARQAVKVHGDTYGLITALHTSRDFGIEGEISTFTEIDAGRPVLDLRTEESVEGLIEIPEYAKLNHRRFSFVFQPDVHLLVFESANKSGTLTPRNAGRFFTRLCELSPIAKDFPDVHVTVIPDHETVRKILAHKQVRSLTIRISPPNADDLKSAEERARQRLKKQNAKRSEETLVAEDNKFLDPDEETRTKALIAQKNGFVRARVTNVLGRSETISTVDTPKERQFAYDERIQTEQRTFELGAAAVLRAETDDRWPGEYGLQLPQFGMGED